MLFECEDFKLSLHSNNYAIMLQLIELGDMNELYNYVIIRLAVILVCWLFCLAAVAVDFWSGRETARALGKPITSRGYRRSVAKFSDYWKVLLFAFMCDLLGTVFSFYVLPFVTMLCCLSVLAIECKSVIENSRARKSAAADIPDIAKQIIQCVSVDKSMELINAIKAMEINTDKGKDNGSQS